MRKYRAIVRVVLVALASAWIGLSVHFAMAADAPVRVVVLGDSLVAGYDLAQDEAFPSQLEKVLLERGHHVAVINAGVSGDTSTGALSRLAWAVPEGTDLVIVELGANDALRGVAPEKTFTSLDKIITWLQQREISVLLAGMLAPPNMGPDYEVEFNAIYGRLAKKHGVSLYPFFLNGVAADPDLNLPDGMHPNAQGVVEIVDRIRPMVEGMIIDLAAGKNS